MYPSQDFTRADTNSDTLEAIIQQVKETAFSAHLLDMMVDCAPESTNACTIIQQKDTVGVITWSFKFKT